MRSHLAMQWRSRPHSLWIPALLLALIAPLAALAVAYPPLALALIAAPALPFLVSDVGLVVIFVLIAETFFPVFQYKSAAITSFPTGIVLLALLLISAACARFMPLRPHPAFRWTMVDYAVVAFVVLCMLSVVASANLSIATGGARDELKFYIVYLAVRWAGPSISAARSEMIARAIVGLLVLIAAVGTLQYFVAYGWLAAYSNVNPSFGAQYMGLGSFSPDGGLHFAVQHRRVYSLLISPLFTAYATTGGALFTVVLYVYRVVPRWAAMLGFGLCVFCTFFTYTRSALVGMAVGLLILAGMFLASDRIAAGTKARLLVSMAASLLVLGAVIYAVKPDVLAYPLSAFTGDSMVTNGHYQNLQQDVTFLLANPFGAGIGRSSLFFFSSQPGQLAVWTENWYFYVAAELGVAGLILYLVICASVLYRLTKAVRQDRARGSGEWISLGTLLWFSAMLVSETAGVPFFSWLVSAALWALVALAINRTLSTTPEPQALVPRRRASR